MELDQRKLKILKCIIQTYLETGEPVGSRTISKADGLDVSSATIRNEMIDLEEMGLIMQPHTSAGRIPTDKGYRLYVDRMLQEKHQEIDSLRGIFNERMDRMENVLLSMAKIIAKNTQYATMISGPKYADSELRMIQLTKLDSRHLIVLIAMEGNIIKNRLIDLYYPISDRDLTGLNVLLNSALQGKTLDDITVRLVKRLQAEAGEYSEVIASILQAVCEAIQESQAERPEVYTSGATNIFKYPELQKNSLGSEILNAFEEKEGLLSLLQSSRSGSRDINVYIGGESTLPAFSECSVITANYELGKGFRGTIGIVGPKRMDYDNVIGMLRTLLDQIDGTFNDEK